MVIGILRNASAYLVVVGWEQGFNWDSSKSSTPWYNVLKGIVDDVAEAGITDVWFPPPSQSSAPEGNICMPGSG